ncbi:MAG TPA: hypothetical protein VE135_13745 [Pyrinomonadaceae bacterium]|nr:hypothetical protein [Pyrinomonadaceae bacterium]
MACPKNTTDQKPDPQELKERKAFVVIDNEGRLEHSTFAPSESIALTRFGVKPLPAGFRCIQVELSEVGRV